MPVADIIHEAMHERRIHKSSWFRSAGDARAPTARIARPLSALLLACAAAIAGPRLARAEPELSLRWAPAQGCPGAAWADEQVALRLGRPLEDVAQGITADVSLSRDGRGYRARLHTQNPDGSVGDREFQGASCKEVADAAALVLSLTISTIAEARAEAEVEVEPTGHQLEDSELAPFRRRRAIRALERARPFAIGLGVLGDWGVRDLPAPGPTLSVAFQHARFRYELSGVWLPGARVDASDRTDVRARVSLGAVRAGLCVRFAEAAAVAFSGCARAELGTEQARGERLGPGGGKAAALWAGAELGLRISRIVARRVELGFGAGALILINRPRFLVLSNEDEALTVQRSWPVSARTSLDAGYRF